MSHVDSVTPAGPVTLAPGATQDFDVAVSGIEVDGTATVEFEASDGTVGQVTINIDRPGLEALTGTATPAPNQVVGSVTGGGTLSVLSVTGGVARFRYAAPSS